MPETYTFEELYRALACFQKMYDIARIVDPARKRVIGCRGEALEKTDEICYRYWEKAELCANCVSMHAYRENKSVMKVECVGRTVMLVTAIPVSVAEKTVVVELLKNVTDDMLVGNGVYGDFGKPVMRAMDEWSDMLSRDVLTQLYNRRFAEERLPEDIARAAEWKTQISVIFFDVNGFKLINDAFGHEAGDLALKAAADSIHQAMEGLKGWAARYGGDEFLVCIHADEKAARRAAEQIRESVQKQKFEFKGHEIRLSVSAGIQSVRDPNFTARELIACADRNMYEEKRLRKGARSLPERRLNLKNGAILPAAAGAAQTGAKTRPVSRRFHFIARNGGTGYGQ